MIKRGTFKLPAESAAVLWIITPPQGAKKVRPLAAYDLSGDSHDWDSWEFEDGVLKVSFGVDAVAGELEYEYQLDGDDSVIVDSNGNQVSITINQYGGGPSTPTFPEGN